MLLCVIQLSGCNTKCDQNNNIYFRVDGGVSSNDFIAQMCADLTGVPVERAESIEMSALGAAYMAGLYSGNVYTIIVIDNSEKSQ